MTHRRKRPGGDAVILAIMTNLAIAFFCPLVGLEVSMGWFMPLCFIMTFIWIPILRKWDEYRSSGGTADGV